MGTPHHDVPQANRDGYLTDDQIAVLLKQRDTIILIAVFLDIVAILVVGTPLLASQTPGVICIVASAIIAATAYFGYQYWLPYKRDIQAGKVAMIAGPVRLDVRGSNPPSYVVAMDHLEFKVEKEILLSLKNGEQYRVYYTPSARKFLAAESLEDSLPKSETKQKRDQTLRLGDDGELIADEKLKRA